MIGAGNLQSPVRSRFGLLQSNLAVAEDHRQRIVKIVSDAARHRAKGVEPFLLNDLLLGVLKSFQRFLEFFSSIRNDLF